MNSTPVRLPTSEEVDQFWVQGVVCLRGVLPVELIAAMEQPVEETLGDPSVTVDMTQLGEALGIDLLRGDVPAATTGTFLSGVDHWQAHPGLALFAQRSPLPELVAHLLRSDKVNLYEDSVLVKEPGGTDPTAFHQDLSYFHMDGTQICTTWTPLDAVDDRSGATRYVLGSHTWDQLYRPNLFVSNTPLDGSEGPQLPNLEDGSHQIVSFQVQPGDVIVHHARTVHGAWPNTSTNRRRRAISVRYAGDDARYFIRAGAPMKPHHHNVRNGDVLDHPDCPIVWPSMGTS